MGDRRGGLFAAIAAFVIGLGACALPAGEQRTEAVGATAPTEPATVPSTTIAPTTTTTAATTTIAATTSAAPTTTVALTTVLPTAPPTVPPTAPPTVAPTFPPPPIVPVAALPSCDPNYTPCVPIDSDVDCAGGSGNGPSYVRGPVQVIGSDIYDLDRDSDGVGCE